MLRISQKCLPRALVRHRPCSPKLCIRAYQSRAKSITLEKLQPQTARDSLALQRRNRPVSPHMTIYKWRYPSLASILHRATGLALSGSLYGFSALYLASPTLGLQVDSATMIAAFALVPLAVKVAFKFGAAMPFVYHGFNGVKHLIWGQALLLGRKESARATWAVLGSSVGVSLGLALWQF